MKLSINQIAEQLTSQLGADGVSIDPGLLSAYKVDGRVADLLCRPASAAEVSAALRICAEAQATVVPWGGGTAMALGNTLRRVDIVMDVKKLDRMMEHDPANLTATLQSGMTIGAAQSALAAHKQFIPFDPPFPELATVGGIIAANLNGPRRSCYGSVRDLVIGMKVTLISGEQIKAGGKVVKNVAGYDMCKLFVGSLGTLGIITEATLRLAPVPESAATLIASGTFAQAQQFVQDIDRSPLLPAAVFLLNENGTERWRVAVWCEGFEQTVARCRRDLAALSLRAGINAQELNAQTHGEFWRTLRDFPLQGDRLIFRITVPRHAIFDSVQIAQNWQDTVIISDISIGTIWLSCPATKTAALEFSALATMARTRRGHAVIFAAPGELRQGAEVWDESPSTISLMRDIKQRFDPKGLLNPGRFLAGI
jgi:glycolate oxidase FAD binding subunit